MQQHAARPRGAWEDALQASASSVSPLLAAALVETLLYGIHVVLFCIGAYFLVRARRRLKATLLLSSAVMFVLATADVALTFRLLLGDTDRILQGDADFLHQRIYPKILIYVTNNFIADGILMHRYYMVWSQKHCVMVVPFLLLLAGTILGYLSETVPSLRHLVPVYIWIIFGMNSTMTLLTAGRIWWVARKARAILGGQLVRRYNTAVAIIIESGAIYSVSVILMMLFHANESVFIFSCISIRVVCIMPALIIVQVALGRATQDMETTVKLARSDPSVVLDTGIATGHSDIMIECEYPGNASNFYGHEAETMGREAG